MEDRVIGKCMFNEWEEKILDQLKNNHRRKLTRANLVLARG
jgi:hypothetical protein